MTRKLAITIAGAVSLGSYESGVVFEIMDAIAQHNAWADSNGPGDRIEVDVLTGASAGGMTASMLAQRILFDGDAMSTADNNPLYNAWVKDVDITGLLTRGADELPSHSIFSSNCVAGISQTYLTGRYSGPTVPTAKPHAARSADGKLYLGLALSNLNGVDYKRTTASGSSFVYTQHGDQQLMSLDAATSDEKTTWETIRSAAVACGAFPFAFRVQNLLRNIADFKNDWLDKTLWDDKESRYFTYTDGGVFQNQPLGMAKNFVDEMTDGHLQAEYRAYLFIAPDPKNSAEVPFTPDPNDSTHRQFNSASADYLQLTKRLVGSIFDQSGFQDWIKAEDVNTKLANLDIRAAFLRDMYLQGKLTPAMTRPVTDVLLQAFFPDVSGPALDKALQAERNRCRRQYKHEVLPLEATPDKADAWTDAVLVLERAAGLHRKEEMYIYDFVADSTKLAGNGLNAFGGFFEEAYRRHDYNYGRTVAQQNLARYAQPGRFFHGLHWTPKPIDPIDEKLNNLKMTDIDPQKREKVCGQICSAADNLLNEMGMNWLERKGVMLFALKSKIRAALAL